MIIQPLEEYAPLFTDDYFEADLYGGRGRGGSHQMTLFALHEMVTANYFRGYFVRAVHSTIRDSLWKDFKDRIEEVSDLNHVKYINLFHINENEMKAIYKPNGNEIGSKGFRASTKGNTANMKSIAGSTHIMIEEFEEVKELEYNRLADSLRTIKAPIKIIRSWNPPPKEHHVVKNYFDVINTDIEGFYSLKPKNINRHIAIFGTYLNNLKNISPDTVARYERYKETNPKYYYNQIMGYVSDGGDNKVYFNWTQLSKQSYDKIDGFKAYGLDFGDVVPTALYEVKYLDGSFYRHEILYESLRSLKARYKENFYSIQYEETENNIWSKHKGVLTYVFNLLKINKNQIIFCDPAQRELIIELREAGYSAVGAKKDKASAINFINRAFNYYTEPSVNIKREYDGYYFETDLNGSPIDGTPKKSECHGLDATEYAVMGLKTQHNIKL